MEDILYCSYKEKSEGPIDETIPSSENCYIVIQAFFDSGKVAVEKQDYPITYGGLYFVNGADKYRIDSENHGNYLQNKIVISKELIDNVAECLECSDVIDEIFSTGRGFHLPLEHYKTVDNLFKRILSAYNSKSGFSKALFVSGFLQLLNYAVYAKEK